MLGTELNHECSTRYNRIGRLHCSRSNMACHEFLVGQTSISFCESLKLYRLPDI
jgi:hypothetical protein